MELYWQIRNSQIVEIFFLSTFSQLCEKTVIVQVAFFFREWVLRENCKEFKILR